MKKRIWIISLVCLVSLGGMAQSLYVGTYNIRNKNEGDSLRGDVWGKRCQVICDFINFEQPDAFGTQELLIGQLNDMLRGLPDYAAIGVGRDDGKEKGEHSAIFYNKKRFKLLRNGDFWLSETPEVPGLGWDAACNRICSWGEFKLRKSRLKVFYFNLHMDHRGVVARREASKLVVRKIREIAKGAPVILTGDFNVDQNNEIYQIFVQSGILQDSYISARQKLAENGSTNSFNPSYRTFSRIDHVFVSPKFKVNNYGVLTGGYWTENEESQTEFKEGAFPKEISFKKYTLRTASDHYPVFVKLNYK